MTDPAVVPETRVIFRPRTAMLLEDVLKHFDTVLRVDQLGDGTWRAHMVGVQYYDLNGYVDWHSVEAMADRSEYALGILVRRLSGRRLRQRRLFRRTRYLDLTRVAVVPPATVTP